MGGNPTRDQEKPQSEEDWANHQAKLLSSQPWTEQETQATFQALSETTTSFLDRQLSTPDQAQRATDLVKGLSRLSTALPGNPGKSEIALLSEAVEYPEHFNPEKFASGLKALSLQAK